MRYPSPERLQFPTQPYAVSGEYLRFGDRVRRRFGLWAYHLGDDVVVPEGTPVSAIGEGEVVFSETLRGSATHRSWGGVAIVGHSSREKGQAFYSVYGHMRDLSVGPGERVDAGQQLGAVAVGLTPENGWWKVAHLHFALYTGPWHGMILPGYWRVERFWKTQRRWWHDPKGFIEAYNRV